MKRVLEVLAAACLVAGIELATGAVSYGADSVVRVVQHLAAGTEPGVSVPRFLVGAGLLVVGVLLVGLDLWARAYWSFLGVGKDCPHCGVRAERVKRRTRHKLLGWILGERLTHRRCKTCGWHGLMLGP